MTTNVNSYDNIDVRINILYDAIYNKNSSSTYIFKPIIKQNISLIDIKMPNDYNYLENALTEKISYIGKYNDKWIFKRTSDSSHPCTLSVCKYSGSRNVNDLGTNELYNPAIHYILSELVINEKIKHIVLPIMFFDIDLTTIQKKVPIMYDELKNEKNKLYLFASEHYFKMKTLKEYLTDEELSLLDWKVLLFQIIFTLSKISEKIKKFRHNMLNLEAIRLYVKKDKKDSIIYKLGITSFEIPSVEFEIKLTDFNFSTTSDYIKNKDILNTTDNPYYDLHYFISSLYLFINENKITIPDELETFINDIVPEKFLPKLGEKFEGLNETEFDLLSSQIIVPAVILKKNNFFKQFIIEEDKMDLSVSPVQNERIKMSNLNGIESDIDYLTPTDDYNGPQMLARKIKSNKKNSKQYYSNMKGSRKTIVPKFEKDEKNNKKSIFENDTIVLTDSSMHNGAGSTKPKKAVQRTSAKKSKAKKLKKRVIKGVDPEPSTESTESSKSPESTESTESTESPSETETDSVKPSSESTEEKPSESTETDETETEEKPTDDEESISGGSETETSSVGMSNVNEKLSDIDKTFSKKMKKVPNNYFGEVPDHLKGKLPTINGNQNQNMMVPQAMPMGFDQNQNMMGQQAMPIGLDSPMGMMNNNQMMAPPPLPPMPQMGFDQNMMPQQVAPQMMPQMMPQQMMPQNMMPMGFDQNMAPQNMMPQMGGGKSTGKYQFVGDKDFFF